MTSKDFNVVKKLGKYLLDISYGIVIGEGSFGSVYLVKRRSDKQLYALKRVSKGSSKIPTLWATFSLLASEYYSISVEFLIGTCKFSLYELLTNYFLFQVRINGMSSKDKNNALNEVRLLASVK